MKKLWQKLKAIAATDEPEHLRRGRLGERAAKAFLQKQGMKFLAANFRSSRGEIDLIFRAGGTAGKVFTGNETDCLLGVSDKAPWKLDGVKFDRGLHVLIAVGVKTDGTRTSSRPALLVVK